MLLNVAIAVSYTHLDVYKRQNDDRVKIALDLCTKWMQGHVKMPQAKKALLSVHAIAKETNDAYIKALAHAIGQACGSVHVETHAFGLVMYEMTSIVIKYGIDDCIPYLEEKLEYYQRMLVECDYRIKYEELEWASFLKWIILKIKNNYCLRRHKRDDDHIIFFLLSKISEI